MAMEKQFDVQRMQQDAERRMREMKKKANVYLGNSEVPPVPNFVSQKPRPIPQQNAKHNNHKKEKRPESRNGLDLLRILNFKNIKIDSDVLIIIALIFMLSNENTDELLLMALLYIML